MKTSIKTSTFYSFTLQAKLEMPYVYRLNNPSNLGPISLRYKVNSHYISALNDIYVWSAEVLPTSLAIPAKKKTWIYSALALREADRLPPLPKIIVWDRISNGRTSVIIYRIQLMSNRDRASYGQGVVKFEVDNAEELSTFLEILQSSYLAVTWSRSDYKLSSLFPGVHLACDTANLRDCLDFIYPGESGLPDNVMIYNFFSRNGIDKKVSFMAYDYKQESSPTIYSNTLEIYTHIAAALVCQSYQLELQFGVSFSSVYSVELYSALKFIFGLAKPESKEYYFHGTRLSSDPILYPLERDTARKTHLVPAYEYLASRDEDPVIRDVFGKTGSCSLVFSSCNCVGKCACFQHEDLKNLISYAYTFNFNTLSMNERPEYERVGRVYNKTSKFPIGFAHHMLLFEGEAPKESYYSSLDAIYATEKTLIIKMGADVVSLTSPLNETINSCRYLQQICFEDSGSGVSKRIRLSHSYDEYVISLVVTGEDNLAHTPSFTILRLDFILAPELLPYSSNSTPDISKYAELKSML